MIYLGVDTSSAQGQLCILRDDELLAQKKWMKQGSHSEVITDQFIELLNEAQLSIEDIQQIYCTTGPGSFTGIRVGLSFCKSLAYSFNLSLVPVNSLFALALSSKKMGSIVSLIDAQKNTFFVSLFKKDKDNITTLEQDKTVSIKDIQSLIKEKSICCGEAYTRYEKFLDPQALELLSYDDEAKYIDISSVILWNLKSKSLQPISWQEFQPHYIRASAAEEKLKQK